MSEFGWAVVIIPLGARPRVTERWNPGARDELDVRVRRDKTTPLTRIVSSRCHTEWVSPASGSIGVDAVELIEVRDDLFTSLRCYAVVHLALRVQRGHDGSALSKRAKLSRPGRQEFIALLNDVLGADVNVAADVHRVPTLTLTGPPRDEARGTVRWSQPDPFVARLASITVLPPDGVGSAA